MICDIMGSLNFWGFHENYFLHCHHWLLWCLGCQAMFNAVVRRADLVHHSGHLVFTVAVVCLVLAFVVTGLVFEEILNKGLLNVGEFGAILCIR